MDLADVGCHESRGDPHDDLVNQISDRVSMRIERRFRIGSRVRIFVEPIN